MSLGAAQSNPENDTQMRVSEATLMQPQRHPTALLEAPDIWEVAIGAPGSPEESLEPFFQISRLFRTHHAEGHPLPTVSTLFGLLELNLQLTVKRQQTWLMPKLWNRIPYLWSTQRCQMTAILHDASVPPSGGPQMLTAPKIAILEQIVGVDALNIQALARLSRPSSFYIQRLIVQLVDRITSTLLGSSTKITHSTSDGATVPLIGMIYSPGFNIRSIWGPQAESSLAELTRKHDEDLANGIQDVPRSAAIDLLRMLINGGLSLPAEKDDDLRVSPEHVYGSNRFLANRTVLVLPLISDPGRDIYKVSKLQWKKLSTGDYSWLTSDGRV
ncbi:SubName: Full=Uncharacterized protein {ECO:0000313/EMBL:CCA76102.1} [Serendipita indica DSM 11827]|nr:SubName: Full=Uncharacterized protein {ECO:0000313/EMBL:CCA76102.1} [Serendipita indica DSM 11827]